MGRPPETLTHFSGLGLEMSSHPQGQRGRGTALSGWARGQPSSRTRCLLAWPPGPGPVLRMVSDPVFQAGLEQCPQDTAVPSCSLNDIRKSTLSPAALLTKGHRCWALLGSHDTWGHRTETKSRLACSLGKSVDLLRPSRYIRGGEGLTSAPSMGCPLRRLVKLGTEEWLITPPS